MDLGHWRKLHNEELHNLYSSHNIVKLVSQNGRDGWDMWHIWRSEMNTECCKETSRE